MCRQHRGQLDREDARERPRDPLAEVSLKGAVASSGAGTAGLESLTSVRRCSEVSARDAAIARLESELQAQSQASAMQVRRARMAQLRGTVPGGFTCSQGPPVCPASLPPLSRSECVSPTGTPPPRKRRPASCTTPSWQRSQTCARCTSSSCRPRRPRQRRGTRCAGHLSPMHLIGCHRRTPLKRQQLGLL